MEYGYNKVNLPRTVTTSENHDRKFRVNCAIHNVKYMKKFYYTNFDVSGKRLKIGQVKTILEVMGGVLFLMLMKITGYCDGWSSYPCKS